MGKKLYLVKCRGMLSAIAGSVPNGIAYVVANSPSEAYEAVLNDLEERNLGMSHERELGSVELIAEDAKYPNCRTRLYVP